MIVFKQKVPNKRNLHNKYGYSFYHVFKCRPLKGTATTPAAIILGFSTIRGTNLIVLPPLPLKKKGTVSTPVIFIGELPPWKAVL